MFSADSPEDLRLMLLHMAAASAGEPNQRRRIACWFRAALQLLDESEAPQPTPLSPAAVRALEELAASLDIAAEHADGLLLQAAGIMRHRSG